MNTFVGLYGYYVMHCSYNVSLSNLRLNKGIKITQICGIFIITIF